MTRSKTRTRISSWFFSLMNRIILQIRRKTLSLTLCHHASHHDPSFASINSLKIRLSGRQANTTLTTEIHKLHTTMEAALRCFPSGPPGFILPFDFFFLPLCSIMLRFMSCLQRAQTFKMLFDAQIQCGSLLSCSVAPLVGSKGQFFALNQMQRCIIQILMLKKMCTRLDVCLTLVLPFSHFPRFSFKRRIQNMQVLSSYLNDRRRHGGTLLVLRRLRS